MLILSYWFGRIFLWCIRSFCLPLHWVRQVWGQGKNVFALGICGLDY